MISKSGKLLLDKTPFFDILKSTLATNHKACYLFSYETNYSPNFSLSRKPVFPLDSVLFCAWFYNFQRYTKFFDNWPAFHPNQSLYSSAFKACPKPSDYFNPWTGNYCG